MSNLPSTDIAQAGNSMQTYVFSTAQAFEAAQRMATALSKSNLVPKEYQNNMPNALIALEIAQRIGASPTMVMQNLYVVHGRPSWSSQFIIAAINSCGRFTPLRFDITGEGDEKGCVAWAEDTTGTRLESPCVSIKMAKDEGWYGKNGSKWKTMPDLMLRYRAASFFGRLYAPEILMGMQTAEEVIDLGKGDYIEVEAKDNSVLSNIQAQIEAEKARNADSVIDVSEPETQELAEESNIEKVEKVIATIKLLTAVEDLAEFQNEQSDFIKSVFGQPEHKLVMEAFKSRFQELSAN